MMQVFGVCLFVVSIMIVRALIKDHKESEE